MTDPSLLPPPGAPAGAYRAWQDGVRARRAAGLVEIDRRRRAEWLKGLAQIVVLEWAAVALMLWSFHTTDMGAGWRAFWGALILGDGGFIVLLTRTWRRVERITPT